MFRNKHFATAVVVLVIIALFAIMFDAEASSCAYWYS